jgi:arginyl-tRNA synthetase
MLYKYSFFNYINTKLKELFGIDELKLKVNVNFNEYGDYTLPLFDIAKKLNTAPDDVYDKIKDYFDRIFTKIGKKYFSLSYKNGFLDFYLQPEHLLSEVEQELVYKTDKKRVVFEFSSPNIAKPFTIGHLRSTNIGFVLSNIFEYCQDEVVRLNYLGDWGTQFGKLIYAYKNFCSETDPDLYTLNSLYIKFHTESQKNHQLEELAGRIFAELEKGNREWKTLWEKFYSVSIEYFNRIYKKLGVNFDSIESESMYINEAQELTQKLLKDNIAKVSQDAVIVDLQEKNLGVALLRKKDEATIYLSRDIAALLSRYKKYKFDVIYYVVGKEQLLHFKQLHEIAKALDSTLEKKVVHIPFGHFRFKGEKIATREGNIVYFEEVMERGIQKVKKILENRIHSEEHKTLTLQELAESIAISALKYYDLKNSIIKDIDFSWDEALNFDGNTGPYVLYSLVRINSLFKKFYEKTGKDFKTEYIPYSPSSATKINPAKIIKRKELEFLLRKILAYYDFVLLAKNALSPHILCNYIFDLLKSFNNFYEQVKIITDDEEGTVNLLYPVFLLAEVVRRTVFLLGLKEVEYM